LLILIPLTVPHSSSSSSSGAGTVGQLVVGVPSDLSLTPPQETELSGEGERVAEFEMNPCNLRKTYMSMCKKICSIRSIC
jgi:hypothetical protein